jgi:hypothetical protein
VRAGVAAAAVLVLALAVSGCGGSSGASKSARRKAVTQYIQRVDTVEQQLRYPLLKVERTYKAFTTKASTLKGSAPKLAGAEATLHTLQTRLSLIDAPPDAKRLRVLLVRLTVAETELAHELTTLAVFLPAYVAALRPLGPADAQLKKSLSAITVPKPKPVPKKQLKAARAAYTRAIDAAAATQAAALGTYLASVASVQARLHGLRPPPALAPAYLTQVSTLAQVRVSGTALVAALHAKQFKRIAPLDRSFRAAAAASSSLAAQRAQIAAVKAYNARVRAVGSLAQQVDGERARIQKLLG